MDVVRFNGVVPMECKESVSNLQNKNSREYYSIWYIGHETCTMSNKVTKNADFRLSSHLKDGAY